jgi:hypothetical protein
MPAPFTTPVADSVPFDESALVSSAIGHSVQDFINQFAPSKDSMTVTYLANGEINTITIYKDPTQTTANRLAVVTMSYDADLNPISEVWQLYDHADGNILKKTLTRTYTFTGVDLTNVASSTV